MIWKNFAQQFAVQFVGHGLILGVVWYWLNLGVGTRVQVGLNAALAIAILVGWSFLDAYGLGNWRNWLRVLPAVAMIPFLGFHFATMLLIPLLCLLVLLPSAAVGRWKLLAGPQYLLISIGLLIAMTVVPAALLNWIPKLADLNGQLGSFGGRALLAYIIGVGAWTALLAHIGTSARQEDLVT